MQKHRFEYATASIGWAEYRSKSNAAARIERTNDGHIRWQLLVIKLQTWVTSEQTFSFHKNLEMLKLFVGTKT
jgi:hypothetical protein